jgi:glutamate N-acetyltransferase / amino-acid N-acetyltransferase
MSVTAPEGFVAAGTACGIKPDGAPDLALVSAGSAVPTAGVFTSNKAAAAPVIVSRSHLAQSAGRAAAVVLSSGNANAATGDAGVAAAQRMCALVGDGLGVSSSEVLVCQTGLIGIPLPLSPIESGIPVLVAARQPGPDAGRRAATAIMTTDTVCKEATAAGAGFTVGGMAKGAAMLAPDMATMLAVLTTDARCAPDQLAVALRAAVGTTFNQLTVDGCTSTNDTVIVMANGLSGTSPAPDELAVAMEEVCGALAAMMASDAEGATTVARVVVVGAESDEDAHRGARRVAESALVKCSLNGADPYWGRVVSELGSAGIAFDLDRVEIGYGGIVVCRGGVAATHDGTALAAHMKSGAIELRCDLGLGTGTAAVLTTDFGHGYIDENRTTS